MLGAACGCGAGFCAGFWAGGACLSLDLSPKASGATKRHIIKSVNRTTRRCVIGNPPEPRQIVCVTSPAVASEKRGRRQCRRQILNAAAANEAFAISRHEPSTTSRHLERHEIKNSVIFSFFLSSRQEANAGVDRPFRARRTSPST